MIKVFLVHGYRGWPNGGWRVWLMNELEKKEIYACALPMPSPDQPIVSEWIQEIARQIDINKDDEIYLVGHSLGVPAILRYLETTNAKNIKGALLVSGPIYKTSKKKVANFLSKPFDFKAIKSRAKKFTVIHGDDDRMVSFDQGEFLAKEVGAKLIAVKKGGHLNGSSGWTSLPHALKALDKMLESK